MRRLPCAGTTAQSWELRGWVAILSARFSLGARPWGLAGGRMQRLRGFHSSARAPRTPPLPSKNILQLLVRLMVCKALYTRHLISFPPHPQALVLPLWLDLGSTASTALSLELLLLSSSPEASQAAVVSVRTAWTQFIFTMAITCSESTPAKGGGHSAVQFSRRKLAL